MSMCIRAGERHLGTDNVPLEAASCGRFEVPDFPADVNAQKAASHAPESAPIKQSGLDAAVTDGGYTEADEDVPMRHVQGAALQPRAEKCQGPALGGVHQSNTQDDMVGSGMHGC